MYYPYCSNCPMIPMMQLGMVCSEIEKEIIYRQPMYGYDSRVAVVKGVKITKDVLLKALAIIKRLPYPVAKQTAEFLEKSIIGHLVGAATILSESLAAQLAVFLSSVIGLNPTRANEFAAIIVNIIVGLI